MAQIIPRLIRAIEPWYDWGTINTFRMEGDQETEGEVYRFEIQWFGIHLGFQVGRTPSARAGGHDDA